MTLRNKKSETGRKLSNYGKTFYHEKAQCHFHSVSSIVGGNMKRIVLMLICSINCLLLAAQVEVKLSQLCGTSWTRSNNNGYYCCQTYDKTQKYRHSSLTYVGVDGQRQKKEFDGRVYFYLSNAVPRFFDKSKVGMAASGRYIIEKSKDGFYCFKILKFSDKELVVVRVISKSDKVIGTPESITYYRKN